jgi:hypothetical protein
VVKQREAKYAVAIALELVKDRVHKATQNVEETM